MRSVQRVTIKTSSSQLLSHITRSLVSGGRVIAGQLGLIHATAERLQCALKINIVRDNNC